MTTPPTTVQEIREAPITGLPGRTPRDQIEAPLTGGREIEPIMIIDVSGSNQEPASPESPITKQQLVEETVPLFVGALEADDSQAKEEQKDGSDEKGGVLTFCGSEPKGPGWSEDNQVPGPQVLDDMNTANVQRKLQQIYWGGRTYLMPAIHLAEEAFQEEFGDRPLRNRPAQEILIITDGKLNDHDEFEKWVAQADETAVVCVAVIGYGTGHDAAVSHYKAIAGRNKFVTVVALTGVSSPQEVAGDLRLLSGTAQAA